MVMIFLKKLVSTTKNIFKSIGIGSKAKALKLSLQLEEKEYGYILFE